MIDLLEMLHRGLVSLTEAFAIQESHTAGFHHGDVIDPDWPKQVGLSQDEAQITDFEMAVQFRYQGWSPACAQCHLQLDYDSDYWMDCSRQEGEICLVHVDCLQDWSHRGWTAAVHALERAGVGSAKIHHLLGSSPKKQRDSESLSECSKEQCCDVTDPKDSLALPTGAVAPLDSAGPEQPRQYIDLVALLHEKRITLNEADDIYWRANAHLPVADADSDSWGFPHGFSRYEARALSHEAGLDEVRLFRYRGWPAACVHCQLPLDHKKDGWRCVEGDDGVFGLMQMTCWLSDGPMQRTWQVAHGALTRASVDAQKIHAIIGSSPPRS